MPRRPFWRRSDRVFLGPLRSLNEKRSSLLGSIPQIMLLAGLALAVAIALPYLLPRSSPPEPRVPDPVTALRETPPAVPAVQVRPIPLPTAATTAPATVPAPAASPVPTVDIPAIQPVPAARPAAQAPSSQAPAVEAPAAEVPAVKAPELTLDMLPALADDPTAGLDGEAKPASRKPATPSRPDTAPSGRGVDP